MSSSSNKTSDTQWRMLYDVQENNSNRIARQKSDLGRMLHGWRWRKSGGLCESSTCDPTRSQMCNLCRGMTMTELRETYTTVHSSMCSTQSLRSSTPSHSGIVHCLHQNRSLSPRRHKSSTKDESSSYPAHYTDWIILLWHLDSSSLYHNCWLKWTTLKVTLHV